MLVVDDSAPMRRLLCDLLAADPEIEIAGTAADPYEAREQIKLLNPDVLTLDVEMPKMDGVTFLRNLMRLRPMPVVMCSSLTQRGAEITLEALALGAVDFVAKPRADAVRTLEAYAPELIAKVKGAARARLQPSREQGDTAIRTRRAAGVACSTQIIGIGASTGGITAIREVLTSLAPDSPGIVMAQHLPAGFTASFAQRLASCCPVEVCEAEDGQPILIGHAYLAPGDRHLRVERAGSHLCCRVTDDPPVGRHRPSVDVLFRSLAEEVGEHAIGVLLTGMGRDGAEGLKEMRARGAATLAQDEESSVVWGMPGAAWRLGAAQSLHPIAQMADRIASLVAVRAGSHRRAVHP